MAFIKGPVCRGEIAVDVIDDRFWVFFANPSLENEALISQTLNEEADNLQLPASTETIYRIGKYWRQYRKKQQAFLAQKAQFIADNYSGSNEVTLANI